MNIELDRGALSIPRFGKGPPNPTRAGVRVHCFAKVGGSTRHLGSPGTLPQNPSTIWGPDQTRPPFQIKLRCVPAAMRAPMILPVIVGFFECCGLVFIVRDVGHTRYRTHIDLCPSPPYTRITFYDAFVALQFDKIYQDWS